MKLLLMCILLTGCAGVTEYHITTPNGVVVDVKNTKDYESYTLTVKKEPDGSYSMKLEEVGVSASDPLKASQEANAKLLDRILSTVPGIN